MPSARVSTPPPDDPEDDGVPPLKTPSWRKQMRMGLLHHLIQLRDPAMAIFLSLPALLVFLCFFIPPLLDRADQPTLLNYSDANSLTLTRLSASAVSQTPFALPFAPETGPLQTSLTALAGVAAAPFSYAGLSAALDDSATQASSTTTYGTFDEYAYHQYYP